MPLEQTLLSNTQPTYSSYVTADYSTRCYEGQHLALAVGAAILLLIFAAGVPALFFVIVMKAFSKPDSPAPLGWLHRKFSFLRGKGVEGLDPALLASLRVRSDAPKKEVAESTAFAEAVLEAKQLDQFGTLYDGLREVAFFAVVQSMAVQLASALIVVFSPEDDSAVLLFVFGVLYWLDTFITAFWQPWEEAAENRDVGIIGLVSLCQAVILAGVQETGTDSGYFIVLLLLAILLFGLLIWKYALPALQSIFGAGAAAAKKKASPSMGPEEADTVRPGGPGRKVQSLELAAFDHASASPADSGAGSAASAPAPSSGRHRTSGNGSSSSNGGDKQVQTVRVQSRSQDSPAAALASPSAPDAEPQPLQQPPTPTAADDDAPPTDPAAWQRLGRDQPARQTAVVIHFSPLSSVKGANASADAAASVPGAAADGAAVPGAAVAPAAAASAPPADTETDAAAE
jgi:hypothetical protein